MPRTLSLKLFGYLLLLLMLDLCMAPVLRIGILQPIFLYLMIPYAAFVWHWGRTLPVALTVGIMRDLTGTLPLGVETAALLIAAWLLDLLILKIERNSSLMRWLTTFLFVFIVSILILALASFLGSSTGFSWSNFLLAFFAALSTAAVMPVFAYVTSLVFRDHVLLKQYELFG